MILSTVTAVTAQSLHFGLKAGGDMHKISGSSFNDEFNLGYHVGAFAEIGLPGKIGLQPEVYFSQVNTTVFTGSGFTGLENYKLSYLNIPILLSFKVAPVLNIQAGPQFGILMNKDKGLVENGREVFKSGDVGIAAGLQFNFTKLKIYGRYVAGLNDVNNIGASSNKWNNQMIHAGVGIRLF